MPSLGATFGRGAATMALWDLANADCVIVMGSNMAENHPIAFRFVVEAQRRGATVIHSDPRFTRTSALADIHAPIRSGTDIAFLGGLIRYVLEHDLWFRDYALNYTNLATIIEDGFQDVDELGGLFSGFDPETGAYKQDTWQYRGKIVPPPLTDHEVDTDPPEKGRDFSSMTTGPVESDDRLLHPNCVYQILKRHYARYTPQAVSEITGCPEETFLAVAEALASNSGRERTTALCYAVGWTHQTCGVQIIRAAALLQGLMGNVGRPGGGMLALRGHVSIQGSTDIPTLYDQLPGYIAQPKAFKQHHTLKDYLQAETPTTGWWNNNPKYVVSLLKAWYGDAATPDNEFGYPWMAKLTGDVSYEPITLSMADGVMKGQFVLGQNPVVGAANSELVEKGLAKLDWLVVRDFALTETAEFWKGRRVQKGETTAADIGTEVFFLPAALAGEKEGTVTNTSRMVQWHEHVLDAPGDSRSDLWFIYHLGRRLKAMYADSDAPGDQGLKALTWDYPVKGERREPSAEAVLKEINGWTVADRKQVKAFTDLKDDGSTAAGCWIYTGVYPEEGRNVANARVPDPPGQEQSHQGWAFAWPANRRTLYNRASADPQGRPWSERKKMIWWDEDQARWTGHDVPDFVADKRPDYRPDWSKTPHGMDALSGADPFMMLADGRLAIFAPSGLKDGPLPTFYEPVESPSKNQMYRQQASPTAKIWTRPGNELHAPQDPRFPHVFTTYRLTELHCAGIPTRIMPHTAELQPEAFVEISPELAAAIGVKNLDWTVLSTLRSEIEVKALVTERMRPFRIGGRTVHQIGMPWVFGWKGYAHGAGANALLAITGDANTSINVTKALTCNIRAGRLPVDQRQPEDA